MNVPRADAPSSPIRLVLADDHPLVLIGLQLAFEGDEFQIVASCEDGVAAVAAVREHKPDVLILDLQMPGLDGQGVLRELRRHDLQTRVLVLSGSSRVPLTAEDLGVDALLSKSDIADLVVDSVRLIHKRKGALPLPPFIRRERMRAPDPARRDLTQVLTRREIEITQLISLALPNKLIARRLDITEGTVKVHLHRIYDKLAVRGRMGLLLKLRQELLGQDASEAPRAPAAAAATDAPDRGRSFALR